MTALNLKTVIIFYCKYYMGNYVFLCLIVQIDYYYIENFVYIVGFSFFLKDINFISHSFTITYKNLVPKCCVLFFSLWICSKAIT